MRRVVVAVALLAVGAGIGSVVTADGDGAGADDAVARVAPSSTVSQRSADGAGSRRHRRDRGTTPPPTVEPPDAVAPLEPVEDAVMRLRLAYVLCVTDPDRCVVDTVAASGTPAADLLEGHVAELRRWNIGRAVDVPGDRITLVGLAPAGTGRFVADVCIVDDLPLVDRGAGDGPADDVPYVNPPLSVMVRWELVSTAAGWRLADLAQLGHFPDSDTCEPPRV